MTSSMVWFVFGLVSALALALAGVPTLAAIVVPSGMALVVSFLLDRARG
jgi:hypothetical protein